MQNYRIPGYVTTYVDHFRPYYVVDKADSWLEKKIVHQSDLDAKINEPSIKCTCTEIEKIKKKIEVCDIKAWDYLRNAKTEYTDKYGEVWKDFYLPPQLPKKMKSDMKSFLEELKPKEAPFYPEPADGDKGCWWIEPLHFSEDLQCRISRQFQKRQAYLGERSKLKR